MPPLITVVSWMIGIFLGSLLALILVRLMTGKINTQYLLYGRRSDGTLYFSPERVQLLIFTLWVGLSYLLETFETRVVNPIPETMHTFPEVPTSTLALVGGSQAVYLAGKLYSSIFDKFLKGK